MAKRREHRSNRAVRKEEAKPYEPTAQDRAILEAQQRRRAAKPSHSRIKVDEEGNTHRLGPDHPDAKIGTVRLMEAIGTGSFEFLDGLLSQLANAGSQGPKPDQRGINFMLSVVEGIAPKDEVEAMLATQMAAVHMASMTFARRLLMWTTSPSRTAPSALSTSLTRTFTAQVDALKRYRSGGEQKVTVEHVHVHAGGQAIVGSVEQKASAGQEEQDQADAKALHLRTSVAAVGPRQGAGTRADLRRCRTDGAGCTAGPLRARQEVSAMATIGTGSLRRTQSRSDATCLIGSS